MWKKVTSLIMAAAMLMSMFAMPAGAASTFKDSDEITYKEEVAIAAGLGLFAGADGKFMPKDTVTRAQMATIVVKMLHGADADARSFKKIDGSFPDIRDFEGGWAEGYINWCASLGVVKGYGDGTFKPGKTLTTAEAVTMILNALKIDAGEGTWPVTVMAKAEELKLFEDLKEKPAADKPFSREELAVVSLAGLMYSPEGKTGYIYDGKVYDSYMDALLIAGDASKITPAANDTLATKVYELKTAEGFIVGNQSTGLEYTQLDGGRNFNISTGLDQVGHYVTVYYRELYQSEEEPGEAYAVSDECTVVKVEQNIDTAKAYKTAFGKTYSKNADITMFDGEYNKLPGTGSIAGYVGGQTAPEGTYIISKGNIAAYVAPVARQVSKVTYIDKSEGSETITLIGINDYQPIENNADEDSVNEYADIAVNDYVVVTKAGTVWNLSPVTAVNGVITRTYTDSDGVPCVTMDGTGYAKLIGSYKISDLDNDIDRFDDYNASCTLYLTEDKEFIGWKVTGGTGADLSRVRYLVGAYIAKEKDSYGKETKSLYAQGMDMNGKESADLIGVLKPDGVFVGDPNYADMDAARAAVTEGFYMLDELEVADREDKKLGVQALTPVGFLADYDEETSPFFLGSNAYASSSSTTIKVGGGSNFTAHICVEGCTYDTHVFSETGWPFYAKSVKYLAIDGQVGMPLETASLGSSYTHVVTEKGECLILMSRNTTGGNVVEAVVFRESADSLQSSDDPIYFTAAQLEKPAGSVPDGVVYEGHDPLTGNVVQLIFDDSTIGTVNNLKNTTGKGFYKYSVKEGIATIGEQATGAETSTPPNMALHDYVLTGVNGTTLSGKSYFSGGSTALLDGDNGADAVVIDTRSEKEIADSGVAEITSIEQLIDLTMNGKHVIYFDGYDTTRYVLGTVFVYKAVKPQLGAAYYLPASAVAGENEVYTLDGEKTTLYVTQESAHTGFVTQISQFGTMTLEQAAGTESFPVGLVVESCSDNKINDTYTITAATKVVDLTNSGAQVGAGLVGSEISAVLAEDGSTVKTLFIIGKPLFKVGTLLFAKGSVANGEDAEFVVVKSDELAMGDTVVLTAEQLTLSADGSGFYEVTGATGTGATLTKCDVASENWKYQLGIHNTILVWDDSNNVRAIDGHTNASASANTNNWQCWNHGWETGIACFSGSAAPNEASRWLNVSGETKVVDLVDGSINSVAALKSAAQAVIGDGKDYNTSNRDSGIMISYWCSGGISDTEPEIIFVLMKDAPLHRKNQDTGNPLYLPGDGEVMYASSAVSAKSLGGAKCGSIRVLESKALPVYTTAYVEYDMAEKVAKSNFCVASVDEQTLLLTVKPLESTTGTLSAPIDAGSIVFGTMTSADEVNEAIAAGKTVNAQYVTYNGRLYANVTGVSG